MNVVWIRYTQYIELSPLHGLQGFMEERMAIFRELSKRGHRIKILTPMTIPSEKLLKDVKNGSITHVAKLDYRWMKNIIYDPLGFCKKDDQVLVVESSPPNFMFDDKYVGGLQIRRCAEIVNSHQGLVLFSQNDPDLPMSLWKMFMAKYPWSHKNNMYRIETKNNTYDEGKYNLKNYDGKEDYGWGDFDECFSKNKKIVLVTKSLCPEKVAEKYDGSRCGYARLVKKGLLSVETLPTAYEHRYVDACGISFNEDPEYDVIYTGYPRNRENYFTELFCGLPDKIRTGVTGPWNEKKAVILDTQDCIGSLKGFISMPKVSNMSRSVLQLAVPKAKQYDWVTSRHLEAVNSGAVCFYDATYKCMEKYLGEDFALKDKADAIKKYNWIRKMSPNARFKIWSYQMELCKKYNFEWYVDKFERLCKKYGVKVDTEWKKYEKPKPIDISGLVAKM
jgi:hypothetical protein